MTAAVKSAEGDFSITDVDIPKINNPDWVLAKIKVSGIFTFTIFQKFQF